MSDKVVSFRVAKDSIRRVQFREPVKHEVVHLYPTLVDYQGKSIPDGNNPRSHDEFLLTSAVAKGIRNTLVDYPEEFKAINRGLLVVAAEAHFNDAKQEITLKLTDWEREFVDGVTEIPQHGLADGGTTDQVIAEMQKEGASLVDGEEKDEWFARLRKAQIHVEVLVFDENEEGIADTITRICQGRNTSQQVKPWSIADFEGNWDWLKSILNTSYPDQIAFEENSKGKCKATVLDVLAILNLFHPYYQGNKSPTSSYSSKGSIQKLYETRQSGFAQLEPVVVDILELHDYIYANFQKAYRGESIRDENEEATKKSLKRYRSKDGKEVFKQYKAAKPLNFTDLVTHMKIEPGMLFPVLASFRALLQPNGDGKLRWFCDPKEFWDNNGKELMERLMDSFTQHKNNFNVLGRDANVYRFLYEAVQSKRDHEELNKLRAQIAKKR